MSCESVCPRCGYKSSDLSLMVCPRCGYTIIYRCHDVKWSVDNNKASMWRYTNMFAVRPGSIISAGEGLTPIVKINGVLSKLETRNPTGSYSDRASSFMVSYLRRKHYIVKYEDDFAYSLTFYAKLDGAGTTIVSAPDDLDPYEIVDIERLGGSIVFEGIPELHYENPLAVEGLKTISFEVEEQNPKAEKIYVPSSTGLLAVSVVEGLREINRLDSYEVIAVSLKGSRAPAMLPVKDVKLVEIEPEEVMKDIVKLAEKGIYLKPLSASAYSLASREDLGLALITGSIRRYLKLKTLSSKLKDEIIKNLSSQGPMTAYELWKLMNRYTLRGLYNALRSLEAEGKVCAEYEMKGARKVKLYRTCN